MASNAFRLPEISRVSGVERMPSADPDAYAAAGQAAAQSAQSSAAAFNSWSVALRNVSEIYRKNEIQASLQQATLHVSKEDADMVAKYSRLKEIRPIDVKGDQDFYDIMQEQGINDPHAVVPMHSVYAEWRRRKYERALETATSLIKDPELKKEFNTKFKLSGMSAYVQDAQASVVAQQAYELDKTKLEEAEAVEQGNYTLARQLVNTSNRTTPEKQAVLQVYDTMENKQFFESALTYHGSDKEYLNFALTQVKDTESPYSQHLDSKERLSISNDIISRIHSIEVSERTALDATLKLKLDSMKDITTLQNQGKVVDSSDIQGFEQSLAEKDPVGYKDYVESTQRQTFLHQVAVSPNHIAQQSLENFRQMMKETGKEQDPRLLQELQYAEEAFAKASAVRLKDPLGWLSTELQVEVQAPDFSSPQALAASISSNVQASKQMMVGFGAEETLLRDGDVLPFVNYIENQPDPLPWIKAINDDLGTKAQSLYKQLAKTGMGKGWIHAARISEYDPRTAELIIKGTKEIKENPVVQARMKLEGLSLETDMMTTMGAVYKYNPHMQASIAEAYKSLYAMIPDQKKDFGNLLMGGVINWNNSDFAAPFPNMPKRDFVQMMKDLPPGWWDSQAALTDRFTGRTLRESILNGQLQLHSFEPGAYVLIGNKKNVMVMNVKDSWDRVDSPFLFKPEKVRVIPEGATQVTPQNYTRVDTPFLLKGGRGFDFSYLNDVANLPEKKRE